MSKVFFAGIMGYGGDIGHRKLAQISSQIKTVAINESLFMDNIPRKDVIHDDAYLIAIN